jgi:DNA-binding SARP family transcriptional activator
MLKFKLFGYGQAFYQDHPLPGFPHQQAWLLLCYLLLNKLHPHYRERLAAVFWEDQPVHIARKNFRNALWRLRQSLQIAGAAPEEYLHISEESLSFISYSPFWLDLDEFEAAVPCLSIPDQELTLQHIAQLENAISLYSGDLLESVYQDWCLYDRERLRLVYFSMLNKLVSYYAASANYPRGLALGELILSRDPTREDIHRQQMWMHWRSGDRGAALAQYKMCTQVLRQEIGVAPMDATRQLFEQILHSPAPETNPLPQPRLSSDFIPVAQSALEQLVRLQKILEQTNSELAQIERMIHQAMAQSGQ